MDHRDDTSLSAPAGRSQLWQRLKRCLDDAWSLYATDESAHHYVTCRYHVVVKRPDDLREPG